MSFSDYLRSAARNWWLLLLGGAAAGIAAFAVTSTQTPQYESSLRLALGPSPAVTRQTRIAQAMDSLNKRTLVTTLAEIASSRRLFEEAVSARGLPPETVGRYAVSANALPEANVIEVRVRGPYRETAEGLTASIAARSERSIESLYRTFAVQRLDDPSASGDPVSPKPERDVPLAVLGGIALGFFLGLLRDRRRPRPA